MNEIVVTQKPGAISTNFEEVKAKLSEQLEVYSKMVFTEETKKSAKDTVAELRKGKAELQNRCKEVKKEWMIPFDAFMNQANELAEMFDKPISKILEQIDAFEQKRIADKKEVISNIYAELINEEEIVRLIPLAKIYNTKWENATFKEKDIREEMMQKKLALKDALETIRGMHSQMEERAIALFVDTFNLSESVKLINEYERQKAEILEREREQMRRAEEERIRAEERRRIEEERRAEEEKAKAIESAKAEVVEQLIPDDIGAEEKGWLYTIMLTPDAKEKLDMYLDSVGIEYYAMEGDE